ncbi:GerAB/ArcD/ProY family transporter [Ruminiclostridium papyrosolvens]|uniref:Spore germination protein n=1 Tax=Ruminiclostridium papyrosolvens C7 TaxID=1330534 RepID=U4QZP2_9FIRM|nr:endospore germination permease [Ruminiclostridium papyrosolvens]EPR09510.1 spore germination protein [Ruminiclostridium papyrosolvens C7]
MRKEQISDKEAIILIMMFIIGTTLIVGTGGNAKNDAWISGILATFSFIPLLLIFSRLLSLFPGKDLFDIFSMVFGKVPGKILSAIYIWYSFHLGGLVLRNFGEFVNVVAFPETPLFIPMLCLGIVCIAAVYLGIEVMSRTTAIFVPLIISIVFVVLILGIPQLRMDYIQPILGNGFTTILVGAFSTFSFPMAETVIFLCIFTSLQTKKSPKRVYIWGTFIAASMIIIITIRNIAVLGNLAGNFYFPSYVAASRIRVGNFIQGVEVTVSFVFILGVFVKCTVCLLAACKGIAKVFNLKDYRSIVVQTGLLMIYFSYTVYYTIIEMNYWINKIYPYYAFPMQVIIPVITWIIAEIKKSRQPLTNK